jgi:hypothetical protein
MSAPVQTTPAWQWPPDVLAFAAQQGLEAVLDPLLEATRRLFPTARSLAVYLNQDPEIRDLRTIIFEVRVPDQGYPDWLASRRRWYREFLRISPPPDPCNISLDLVPLDP